MPEKLLIVEESLRDLKAHWFQYINTITKAAENLGYKVDVACHKNAAPQILNSFSSFPIFDQARYLSDTIKKYPGDRYYSFITHSLVMVKALWNLLKSREQYNHVFVPTVLVHHLLGWYIIMTLHPRRPQKLTLFFVTNPGTWDATKKKAFFAKSTFIQKKLLQLFKKLIAQNKVVLAVETEGAKNEFEELTGLPFLLLPHPVPFTNKQNTKDNLPSENAKLQTLNFSCLGFARHEKGSDLLKSAVHSFIKDENFNVHFNIQWTDPFTMPDGTQCESGPVLNGSQLVSIIDRPVLEDEYSELLFKTDCMILPYRNSSYYARVSRIAIEAVCIGIPVIYTKGGWLDETISKYGVGIGIEDESISDLKNAITTMERDYAIFSISAKDKMEKAIEYFSPGNFIKLLFNT